MDTFYGILSVRINKVWLYVINRCSTRFFWLGSHLFKRIECQLIFFIFNITQDFRDYILQLNDILTRKATCIASLQEKLSKFPSQWLYRKFVNKKQDFFSI